MVNSETPTAHEIAWGKANGERVEITAHNPDEVVGDDPGDINMQVVEIGQVTDVEDFPGFVGEYLEVNPDLLDRARVNEEDVGARMDKAKNIAIIIGKGAAVLAAGASALTIAFVIYKSRKEKQVEE